MKKQYIVPSMTVERFVLSNVIATSTIDYGGSSSQPGSPQDMEAPQRKGIWDE